MPLPYTAPSPDFNLRPTTFSFEDLKQDSRAVALLVIKDTTNWLAQHKDACTAIKYMIASSAARLLSNKPPCGTALTLAAQDIIKLLLVKYVHRDRGFHAEMPLKLGVQGMFVRAASVRSSWRAGAGARAGRG